MIIFFKKKQTNCLHLTINFSRSTLIFCFELHFSNNINTMSVWTAHCAQKKASEFTFRRIHMKWRSTFSKFHCRLRFSRKKTYRFIFSARSDVCLVVFSHGAEILENSGKTAISILMKFCEYSWVLRRLTRQDDGMITPEENASAEISIESNGLTHLTGHFSILFFSLSR